MPPARLRTPKLELVRRTKRAAEVRNPPDECKTLLGEPVKLQVVLLQSRREPLRRRINEPGTDLQYKRPGVQVLEVPRSPRQLIRQLEVRRRPYRPGVVRIVGTSSAMPEADGSIESRPRSTDRSSYGVRELPAESQAV